MKTGGGIFDYTPERIDALARRTREEAGRGPEGVTGLEHKETWKSRHHEQGLRGADDGFDQAQHISVRNNETRE